MRQFRGQVRGSTIHPSSGAGLLGCAARYHFSGAFFAALQRWRPLNHIVSCSHCIDSAAHENIIRTFIGAAARQSDNRGARENRVCAGGKGAPCEHLQMRSRASLLSILLF